jgi:hypothetical protein
VILRPTYKNFVRKYSTDALNCGDGPAANRSDRQKTRAHLLAIDMHGADLSI